MTIALLAALVLVNALYVVHLDRKDGREREERNRERDVMDRLLQRIQAPETVQYAVPTAPDLPAVNPMEDDDYWKAQEEALEEMERRRVELERLT